jgi:transcriptional regulator with PAS, ATPase and Fis domain
MKIAARERRKSKRGGTPIGPREHLTLMGIDVGATTIAGGLVTAAGDVLAVARRAVPSISAEALHCLRAYPFPGNVRELENEVERALALADDGRPIGAEHLSDRIRQSVETPAAAPTLNEAIERLKRRMIDDALRECGSKTRAAKRLGLSRQSLQQMLRRRQP